ncbi:selenophosphate synthase [Thermosediminibacter litoriperuensis]|uniref:Selenide, water dikinase n=1 Tax=Thermosediminibacter litoriperuensis TaxID=291989 RepID=A0A5S5AZV4_9FIRM|nr:selenophosphate synthase [Thermosediminibacter litoriperuensis]
MGLETSDDAAVYKINEELAVIHTVDFFTPVVDDPYLFGQIAACNALSDIYAMGGRPLLALNIVGFPEELVEDVLPLVMKGGADKVIEAGAIIAGGHSIKTPEPVYGLSVLGAVHPAGVLTNAGAKPGDVIVLTKPLGTGVFTTAAKTGMADSRIEREALETMSTLNKAASEAAVQVGVNAVTDITGFGLLGHAYEMAAASQVTIKIKVEKVPVIPGIFEYAAMGLLPGGLYANRKYLADKVVLPENIREELADVLFDPQTSGGLLISCPEQKAAVLMEELKNNGVKWASIIGRVEEKSGRDIIVE